MQYRTVWSPPVPASADVFVGDLDDAAMIRVYARENATQRGNSGTAVAGSVAAVLKLLGKAILTRNLARILARFQPRGQEVLNGIAVAGSVAAVSENSETDNSLAGNR